MFGDYREAGLAHSTIRNLNAQDPDELMLINIGKTKQAFEEGLAIMEKAMSESDVPITAAGGIDSVERARSLVAAGAEKVLVTSALSSIPGLLEDVVMALGSQSVVAGIEYAGGVPGQERISFQTNRGEMRGNHELVKWALELQDRGAGELAVFSKSRDGTQVGLDLERLSPLARTLSIPVTGVGGVGNFDHLVQAFKVSDLSAIACGTLFTFGDNNPIRARSYMRNYGVTTRS